MNPWEQQPGQPANPESKKQILKNLFFKAIYDKQGAVVGYKNSEAGRKSAEIAKPLPLQVDLSEAFDVEVIEDTRPEDPLVGKYLVRILRPTNTNWKFAEDVVRAAEISQRRASSAGTKVYRATGIPAKMRRTSDTAGDVSRVVARAMELEEKFNSEVLAALGDGTSPEHELIKLQWKDLVWALRRDRAISEKVADLREEEVEILKDLSEPDEATSGVLREIRQDIDEFKGDRERLLQESPEAFYGLHLKELKGYKRELEKGRIVETPYVREQAEDIVDHLRANKPVLVYGHLGTGKTELAMHVAKEYLKKEALVLSGSKYTSLAELYGHQILAVDKMQREDLDRFSKEVEGKFNDWCQEHRGASEEEKNRAHDRLLQIYLTQFKGGTISEFFLGPIYRAMAEGRPVIIDEVNAIPHEVLISLNHILTRRPGERMNVQQDSGAMVEIQEGFGIIMTANLNQGQDVYVDRQEMDPAFLSRLHKIEYDYIPQANRGTLEQDAGPKNELFHLLLAKVMDQNGNFNAPERSLEKLFTLAQAARTIQNVFAGKEVDSAYYFKQAGITGAIQPMLREAVLSLRALDKIMTQWVKDGYKYELDHYLYNEFVAQTTSATERAYLYQLLKDQYGFFRGQGWEQHPNYGGNSGVSSFDVKAPKNSPADNKFLGPRQVVEAAFGKAPSRKHWPGMERKSENRPDKEFVPGESMIAGKYHGEYTVNGITFGVEWDSENEGYRFFTNVRGRIGTNYLGDDIEDARQTFRTAKEVARQVSDVDELRQKMNEQRPPEIPGKFVDEQELGFGESLVNGRLDAYAHVNGLRYEVWWNSTLQEYVLGVEGVDVIRLGVEDSKARAVFRAVKKIGAQATTPSELYEAIRKQVELMDLK